MRFVLSSEGEVQSLYNRLTCHEYVFLPGQLWKMIFREGERSEIPIYSKAQRFTAHTEKSQNGDELLEITYPSLQADGRCLHIELKLTFTMENDRFSVTSSIVNHENFEIMELHITAASGIRSLGGKPEDDTLAWPTDLGRRVDNPAFSDLSQAMGGRKYERPDQYHTDLDVLYPGFASMQWFELFNKNEGIYIGSHDTSRQTTCLHVERDTKTNILRLGIVRYPFASSGESWTSAPIVYAAHEGDWHAGSKIYRSWMELTGWQKPVNPAWAREFKGWLRIILKQHHGEINWDFSNIPTLFDEVKQAGMDTVFLLGWEKGGFARMWPDYVVDSGMGGEDGLKKAIDCVHEKGGRVIMFLSYLLIDRESEFYKKDGGDRVTMKSCWDQEIPFSETYCGEGTWRKRANPAMPMYYACPSAPAWQIKMENSARYLVDLGADGVLFDLGGLNPYFCFDKSHPHAKPSFANSTKERNYRVLRDVIREKNPGNAILMEDNVDVFAQFMDISQGWCTRPAADQMLELYRYTFPEAIMTNRECGQDEENYRSYANYSFLYGLRFDMSIFRCCGTLSDIPNYAAYLRKLNALYDQYADYILRGRFTDTDGFAIDNPLVRAKSYAAENGSTAIVVWNPTVEKVDFTICPTNKNSRKETLGANSVQVYLI